MKDVARIFRAAKEIYGLSQEELGFKMGGVSGSNISKIISRKVNAPGLDTIENFCRAFNVSPLLFFDDEVARIEGVRAEEFFIPDHLKEVLRDPGFLSMLDVASKLYRSGISPQEVEHIFAAIEAVKGKKSVE